MSRKGIVFKASSIEDAEKLLADIRPDDLVEITCSNPDALAVIKEGISSSLMCWTVFDRGELIAIFGAAEMPGDPGTRVPWLIGTRRLEGRGVLFQRYGREYLKLIAAGCRRLYNMVHARNTKSIRWLEGLGFFVMKDRPIDVNGHVFYPFEMRLF